MRHAIHGFLCVLLVPGAIAAQVSMRGQGKLRGVAYDSLAHAPLAGAEVWVRGTTLRTITDSGGHFRFDTLTEGRYVLVLAHAGLDSAGLFNLAASVAIEAGRVATVLLATPSLRTIWSRRCSTAPAAAADSGLLMGLVTDAAAGNRLAGARVVGSWLALEQQGVEVTAENRAVATLTDSLGWYYACGLSTDATVHVRAFGSTDSTGSIQVYPGVRGVARRDFTVGATARGASVRATVTGADGRPVLGARVAVDSTEAVAKEDGVVVLTGLPAGTRWLTARAVGRAPLSQAIDLRDGDTLRLVLPLGATAVMLDTVRVETTRFAFILQGIEDRKRSGFGTIRTEADFVGRYDIVSTLQGIPFLRVERQRGSLFLVMQGRSMGMTAGCLATVYLDGFRTGYNELLAYQPAELLAIEVYPNASQVPMQFASPWSACGVVLVWTKYLQ